MLFYSILTIPKLQRTDRGRYTCRVTSGDQSQHKQVNVSVYGEFPPLTVPDIQEIHRQSSARITHSRHACLIFLSFCDQRILYHRLQNVTAVSKLWRQLFLCTFFPHFQTDHLSTWNPETDWWWRCKQERNLIKSLPNCERSRPQKSFGKWSEILLYPHKMCDFRASSLVFIPLECFFFIYALPPLTWSLSQLTS